MGESSKPSNFFNFLKYLYGITGGHFLRHSHKGQLKFNGLWWSAAGTTENDGKRGPRIR